MNIEKTFIIPISDKLAHQRIAEYFSQAGYRLISEKGALMKFERGSRLGSWLAINPANHLCLAEIQIKPKGNQVQIQSEFDIKAIMKDDTHFTQKFWASEMKELEIAIREGKYIPVRSKKLSLRALLAIFKSLVSPLAYIVIWAALSLGITFLIMRLPGSFNTIPEIVALGAMIISGIMTYFITKFWKRWRQAQSKNSVTGDEID